MSHLKKITDRMITFVLTVLLMGWVVSLFIDNPGNKTILNEIYDLGMVWTILIASAFLIMVAFYCRTLQNCLKLVKPENRARKPGAVWYMFLMPFNFIEDFFIVIDVGMSLSKEKNSNPELKDTTDLGIASGVGWAIAQLLSFVPNNIGQIAGALGMVLVVYHWMNIAKINKLLSKQKTER